MALMAFVLSIPSLTGYNVPVRTAFCWADCEAVAGEVTLFGTSMV